MVSTRRGMYLQPVSYTQQRNNPNKNDFKQPRSQEIFVTTPIHVFQICFTYDYILCIGENIFMAGEWIFVLYIRWRYFGDILKTCVVFMEEKVTVMFFCDT